MLRSRILVREVKIWARMEVTGSRAPPGTLVAFGVLVTVFIYSQTAGGLLTGEGGKLSKKGSDRAKQTSHEGSDASDLGEVEATSGEP